MFYYSINSKEKIVHFKDCHHLKKIKKENMRTFKNICEVRNREYKICSCCSPITEKLKREYAEIRRFCLGNGLYYFIQDGTLHIITARSKWKVLVSNTKSVLELHHKNIYEGKHKDSVPGYHKQNFVAETILEYMEYIIKHDFFRSHYPIQVVAEKSPPRKGTKRWNKQQRAIKKKERKRAIWNVLNLIDSLSVGCAIQA